MDTTRDRAFAATNGADMLREASAAYAIHDGERFRVVIATILEGDPESIEGHRWSARGAQRDEDWTNAARSAAVVLRNSPKNAEALLIRARAMQALMRWEEAFTAWGAVTQARPHDLPAWRHLGVVAALAGRGEEARVALQVLRDRAAMDVLALAHAAHAALEMGDIVLAGELFGELGRADDELFQNEIQGFRSAQDLRGIAVAWGSAPSDVAEDDIGSLSEALVHSAIYRERAGRHADALLDYRAALCLFPEDAIIRRGFDRSFKSLERAVGADESGRAAAEIVRACAGLPHHLARQAAITLDRAGHEEAAIRLLSDVLAGNEHDIDALLALSRIWDRRGMVVEAVQVSRRLVRQDPSPESERTLTRARSRLKAVAQEAFGREDYVVALDLYRTFHPSDAEHEMASARIVKIGQRLLKQVRVAYKEGDLEAVLRLAPAAATALPGEPGIFRAWARAAMKARDHATAVAAWRALAELEPDDAAALVGLGRGLLNLKDLDGARQALHAAERLGHQEETAAQLRTDIEKRAG